jgi:hypothetical protein
MGPSEEVWVILSLFNDAVSATEVIYYQIKWEDISERCGEKKIPASTGNWTPAIISIEIHFIEFTCSDIGLAVSSFLGGGEGNNPLKCNYYVYNIGTYIILQHCTGNWSGDNGCYGSNGIHDSCQWTYKNMSINCTSLLWESNRPKMASWLSHDKQHICCCAISQLQFYLFLHGCETRCLSLGRKHRLKVFENSAEKICTKEKKQKREVNCVMMSS